jgi:aminopeptidase N
MTGANPNTIFLKDYQAPDFRINTTRLHFRLEQDYTEVQAELQMRRNGSHTKPLQLHGQELQLLELSLDGEVLGEADFVQDEEGLTLHQVPDRFVLSSRVRIEPHKNTALEGLYMSRGLYCTQCEAEGFRKITFYLDRPDVLSVFTTTVAAPAQAFPLLLSNGNCVETGRNDDGTHFATWHDPFPKPAYLFALVAGSLACIEDRFVTCSGREVTLRIFVEDKDKDKCGHAMRSLQNAMKWDEEVYGREYDLDIFMIVAVDDFNMGAMENKGLNVFNTSCVLADPKTTTDTGFERVEAVVAHEYFHNWSGNRVTCRDWFQLSLKEGFTVFRDAEFSADMGSRTVKRVGEVQLLRTLQFAEDAGPMAHPVQPSSFIEISNFYTLTVYEKGAEVVRMIRTLMGPELFRSGTDLYFSRHDGQAVTIEDFVQAMADVSGRDFSDFMAWYRQAGTPVLRVEDHYDPEAREYHLTVHQSCPATPEATSAQKQPFHIPLAIGLLGEAGALRLQLKGEELDAEKSDNTHQVLELHKPQQTFIFCDLPERPVPSLLRGFSAPVKLHYNYSTADLLRLMTQDQDGFCRWDACQQLGLRTIERGLAKHDEQAAELIEAFALLLDDSSLDPALVALMLDLPSEVYVGEQQTVVDVDGNHRMRQSLQHQIATALQARFYRVYESCQKSLMTLVDQVNAEAVALRSLKNRALGYLMLADDPHSLTLCQRQFEEGANMTDVSSALAALVYSERPGAAEVRELALRQFYQRWQHEPLVVNQWLAVQAASPVVGDLARIKALRDSPVFDIKNPNKVRSLIGVFCNQNLVHFHAPNGSGYEFLADQVLLLNRQNPQIAARLLTPLTKWRRYDAARQGLMRAQLHRIAAENKLSKDVFEVVNKSLVE